jgi:hypothetical protein
MMQAARHRARSGHVTGTHEAACNLRLYALASTRGRVSADTHRANGGSLVPWRQIMTPLQFPVLQLTPCAVHTTNAIHTTTKKYPGHRSVIHSVFVNSLEFLSRPRTHQHASAMLCIARTDDLSARKRKLVLWTSHRCSPLTRSRRALLQHAPVRLRKSGRSTQTHEWTSYQTRWEVLVGGR